MDRYVVYVPREIRVPSNADEWGLYTHEKGVRLAGRRLTGAVLKAVRKRRPGLRPDEAYREALREIGETQRELEDFGARDSEPTREVRRVLRQVFGDDVAE